MEASEFPPLVVLYSIFFFFFFFPDAPSPCDLDREIMYIFKQVFRIGMIFVFLSSELYIKDKHSNGVKFSNGDCYIIWCHK